MGIRSRSSSIAKTPGALPALTARSLVRSSMSTCRTERRTSRLSTRGRRVQSTPTPGKPERPEPRSRRCGVPAAQQGEAALRRRGFCEESKRDTLTTAENNKAATDQAAQLDAAAAAIRSNLAKTEPAKSTNSLGKCWQVLLPLSAVTAASAQQALVSGIAKLLIAAALALPELLIGTPVPAARKPEERISAEPAVAIPTCGNVADVDTVGALHARQSDQSARRRNSRPRHLCAISAMVLRAVPDSPGGCIYLPSNSRRATSAMGLQPGKSARLSWCAGIRLTSPRQALVLLRHILLPRERALVDA